jgi:mono/diheme cytochrome c family protein
MARFLKFLLIVLMVLAGLGAVFIYTGVYNIGADAPHSRLAFGILEQLRDRSIVSHSSGIAVPRDLSDPKRIAAGAGLYQEMCTGCHLAPGMEKTEMAQGLYPAAPELARGNDLSPAEQFWVIKHGVKLSAMPAWGKTHEDQLIWDMVAFIRQMPKLSPEQYKATVASAPESHEEMMADEHAGEAAPHTH